FTTEIPSNIPVQIFQTIIEHIRLIDPEATTVEMLHALSEGNIGAFNVLLKLLVDKEKFMLLLRLDSLHLYGDRIRELYKETCGADMDRFVSYISNELSCQICGPQSAIAQKYSGAAK
ncbi:MAG: hypothetical protein AAB949_00370, partial [Patescibacteria group bacterium]